MEDFKILRHRLKTLIEEIFTDLSNAQYRGEIPRREIIEKTRMAIFKSEKMLAATDEQISRFFERIEELKAEMHRRDIVDRSVILKRIEDAYSEVFDQKLEISGLINRLPEAKLEYPF